MAIFFLRSLNLIAFTSIPSRNKRPSGISIVLPRHFANVVLPHPTGPTIAISSPGKILKLIPFRELNFETEYFIKVLHFPDLLYLDCSGKFLQHDLNLLDQVERYLM